MTSQPANRTPTVTDPELDISARSFWNQTYDQRERAFKRLRDDHPVAYHRPFESTLLPPDEDTPGFWSLTTFDDIRAVSRKPEVFSNTKGVFMERFPEVIIAGSHSFLAMDGAEHRSLRGVVMQAFQPKHIRTIETWIAEHARDLVDEMIAKGEGDFCALYATQLPGRIFAHFFGLPPGSDDAETIMDASEKMLAWDDPDCAQGREGIAVFAEEADRIQTVALDAAERVRKDPGDDLVSWVVQAEFEGRSMEEWEIAAFFTMLGSAANDTTRHSTAHAIRLLTEHPDQRAWMLEDLENRVDSVVDEVLRYATPVMHFCRTALEDTQIRGQEVAAGEQVAMWYCSGNRDAAVFQDPNAFDCAREGNRHLGFGGGGPHFCLGSVLARQMLRSSLIEVYTRMPDITLAADPVYQVNNFLHGVARLPVRWTPPVAA